MNTRQKRIVYVLRIAAKPGSAGIHALRALLKRLGRSYGFRCIDAREERGSLKDAR